MTLFITVEGGEGCGKSTQSRRLYRRLTGLAIPALLTHEPGVTRLGKKITRLLKWTDAVAISPLAELLLFNASRAQLVEEIIRHGLEKGVTVICDRFADSTTAYQGYGRGLDMTMVSAVNKIGTSGLVPDLTVLLDMPAEKGLARKATKKDRFEAESRDFHRRVREGYLKMAKAEPERWLVIDAEKSKEEIENEIWARVSRLLPR
ncbi:MAG: dTMP kinase [Chloroflexota bacterium]